MRDTAQSLQNRVCVKHGVPHGKIRSTTSIAKTAHIRFASEHAGKFTKRSASDAERLIRSSYAARFQEGLDKWREMPPGEKTCTIQGWQMQGDAAEFEFDSDASTEADLETRLTGIAESGGDRPLLGMGDAVYPISPEIFHKHYEAQMECERMEQLQSNGGRLARSGLEREVYNKVLQNPLSVSSRSPVMDDPAAFDYEEVRQQKDESRTCYERHAGLCAARST